MAEPTPTPQPEVASVLPLGPSSLEPQITSQSYGTVILESSTLQIQDTPSQFDNNITSKPATPRKPNPRQQLNKLYALPAPLRTFPLPTFVPHNPLSLFHILYTWLSQTVSPQSSHFDTLYQGRWSPETRTIHVTDTRSIRGLWEHGFYGKGSLSRSEPNWLEKEKKSSGPESKTPFEVILQQRRAERQQTKWERARLEREAIEQKLLEEAEADKILVESTMAQDEMLNDIDTSSTLSDEEETSQKKVMRIPPPPVTPLKLLVLPNSALDLYEFENSTSDTELEDWLPMPVETLADEISEVVRNLLNRVEMAPLESQDDVKNTEHLKGHTNCYSLINSHAQANGNALVEPVEPTDAYTNGVTDINDEIVNGSVNSKDTVHNNGFALNGSALANGPPAVTKIKRQKSVRFSPTVEKNTFTQSEPPSPDRAILFPNSEPAPIIVPKPELVRKDVKNQEHFQLTREEAFFLSYALGALTIIDPITKSPIPVEKLFDLFRQSSSFPPMKSPSTSPDDSFMLNYVVYHHYRSLGWCVRGGSKFSCDFMLYNRGPVFTHAAFAVLILPSYNDEYWSRDESLKEYVKIKERRTWHWLHCINRVITQVKKTLILVYVDIPAPFDKEKRLALDNILGRYKIREVTLGRWSPNRQRKVMEG
jgi:tRNA-splicing endonuclease subunit Sen2